MALSQLDTFAEQARIFCRWATGEDGGEMNVASVVRRVSALYAAALDLPRPFTEGMSSDLTEAEAPTESLARVTTRAAGLPLQVYWEVLDPIVSTAEDRVAGSVVDDLGDIYRDIARGLILFESGHRAEALWEWAFHFRIHWGEHATGIMRAFHAYAVQEEPDALSRDA